MQFQDWQHTHRLMRIGRAFARRGTPVQMIPHQIQAVSELTLAGGEVSAVQLVEIEEDGHFIWMGQAATHTIIGVNMAANMDGSASIEFVQVNSSRRFARGRHTAADSASPAPNWIPLRAVCGTGERPFFWPYPIILARNELIEIRIANGNAGGNRTYFLSLIGVKAIPAGRMADAA